MKFTDKEQAHDGHNKRKSECGQSIDSEQNRSLAFKQRLSPMSVGSDNAKPHSVT